MVINFHKMQALGNDFVIIESRCGDDVTKFFDRKLLQRIGDRKYGIGCDQIVIFYRENCFIHAYFFNNDGSSAEICGNASRCLGKLMRSHYGIAKFSMIASGKDYDIQVNPDKTVSVTMCKPSFRENEIGLTKSIETPWDLDAESDLQMSNDDISQMKIVKISCVSVGNPHLILFVEKIPETKIVERIGAFLSTHPLFKNGINVSFVKIVSEDTAEQCSYERGTGLTLACGSGACATAAVAKKCNLLKGDDVVIQQKGGDLSIHHNENGTITQTGTATYVFSGIIEV